MYMYIPKIFYKYWKATLKFWTDIILMDLVLPYVGYFAWWQQHFCGVSSRTNSSSSCLARLVLSSFSRMMATRDPHQPMEKGGSIEILGDTYVVVSGFDLLLWFFKLPNSFGNSDLLPHALVECIHKYFLRSSYQVWVLQTFNSQGGMYR